jgi:hypothetical protein
VGQYNNRIEDISMEGHALDCSFLEECHDEILAICDINTAEVPCTIDHVKLAVK